jgi:hypothetical protein
MAIPEQGIDDEQELAHGGGERGFLALTIVIEGW